jgi:hypothetical protein
LFTEEEEPSNQNFDKAMLKVTKLVDLLKQSTDTLEQAEIVKILNNLVFKVDLFDFIILELPCITQSLLEHNGGMLSDFLEIFGNVVADSHEARVYFIEKNIHQQIYHLVERKKNNLQPD